MVDGPLDEFLNPAVASAAAWWRFPVVAIRHGWRDFEIRIAPPGFDDLTGKFVGVAVDDDARAYYFKERKVDPWETVSADHPAARLVDRLVVGSDSTSGRGDW